MLYKIEIEDKQTLLQLDCFFLLCVYLVPHISHVVLPLRLLLS